jgi:hypothetical protein
MTDTTEIRNFDLNIEKVLEGWETCHAIRELVSNALDEQMLKRILTQLRKGKLLTWYCSMPIRWRRSATRKGSTLSSMEGNCIPGPRWLRC